MNKIKSILGLAMVICCLNIGTFGQNAKPYENIKLEANFEKAVDYKVILELYKFFKEDELFKLKESKLQNVREGSIWNDPNNCEDRANAVSFLLDAWGIPNYKAWVFQGRLLKKKLNDNGKLKNKWKYHVAVAIPTIKNGLKELIVIDYAIPYFDSNNTTEILNQPKNLQKWADDLVEINYAYYFLTENIYANYPWSNHSNKKHIELDKFWERATESGLENNKDENNFDWTIEGLTCYNGAKGADHYRCIDKKIYKKVLKDKKEKFYFLRENKPTFIQ